MASLKNLALLPILALAVFATPTRAQSSGYLPYNGASGGFIPYQGGPNGGFTSPMPTLRRPLAGASMTTLGMNPALGSSRSSITPLRPLALPRRGSLLNSSSSMSGLPMSRPASLQPRSRAPVGSYPFRVPPNLNTSSAPSAMPM